MHAQSMPVDVDKVLQKRSMKDFQPLKTKAFHFASDKYKRQMSAQETYGYIRNQSSTGAATNADTRAGKEFAEYYHSQSSVAMHPKSSIQKAASLVTNAQAGTSVMKVNEGSINIVTQNLSTTPDGFSAAPPKEANVVDMNQRTTFPLNVQRKKNKNDFYRFLL